MLPLLSVVRAWLPVQLVTGARTRPEVKRPLVAVSWLLKYAYEVVACVVEAKEAKRLVLVLLVEVRFWSVALVPVRVPELNVVEVALVIVALVPRILVNSALVAESTDAKKEVEVELVLVLFNRVMFWKVVEEVKMFCPEKVLLLARRVDDAVLSTRQTPAIAKQPPERLKPFAAVLVAPPVSANWSAETPLAKVLVPCPAPTVIAPPKVEVAVVVPMKFAAAIVPPTESL